MGKNVLGSIRKSSDEGGREGTYVKSSFPAEGMPVILEYPNVSTHQNHKSVAGENSEPTRQDVWSSDATSGIHLWMDWELGSEWGYDTRAPPVLLPSLGY